MSRASKIYAYFISTVGLSLGLYCVYSYFTLIVTCANPKYELEQFGILLLLYILCRCFPIYIRDDYAIDMSFICNLAAILCKGPVVAATMILFSTLFVIEPSHTEDRKFIHIFNTSPIKTAFNTSNFILTVYFAGVIYEKSGGIIGT